LDPIDFNPMKADREEFETARARKPHWVGNDPLLEIGRARFLVMTVRVKWCRPAQGRARIAGRAMPESIDRSARETFQTTRDAGKERQKKLLR